MGEREETMRLGVVDGKSSSATKICPSHKSSLGQFRPPPLRRSQVDPRICNRFPGDEDGLTDLAFQVTTSKGDVKGTLEPQADGTTVGVFYGIPYAESPTGPRRFQVGSREGSFGLP